MRSYGHFTLYERERLAQMRAEGKSQSDIARELGKHRSSISRELRRNGNKSTTYNAWHATSQYLHRRKACRKPHRVSWDQELLAFTQDGLAKYWSPEAIVARWKMTHPQAKLSHSTLYQALRKGLIPGRTAKQHLRRRGAHRYPNRSKFNTITPDQTIHERPGHVQTREAFGHWEGDSVVCGRSGSGRLFTCVERSSRLLVAARVDGHDARSMREAMIDALAAYQVDSLTLDNGSEFARHREVAARLNTTIYFADPHSPWQRGSNEQVNGLLRFFFPKGTDFAALNPDEISSVVDSINDRPRKCLAWLSPREVFLAMCCS